MAAKAQADTGRPAARPAAALRCPAHALGQVTKSLSQINTGAAALWSHAFEKLEDRNECQRHHDAQCRFGRSRRDDGQLETKGSGCSIRPVTLAASNLSLHFHGSTCPLYPPKADTRLALAFRYASFAKSANIDSDLLWVLHVKKALLGKFACEVWIDLPERGHGGFSFIRPLQMPQGSNPV